MAERDLLEPLLDSWDRNNTILTNLFLLVPADSLDLRAAEDSPSIAQLFTRIHYVRLVFVAEDAPEFARDVPKEEWEVERDAERIYQKLEHSAKVVRDAVKSRVALGKALDLHYDHPVLMLQHMLWHEGYHHGQIKLILKLNGQPLDDEDVGLMTWDIWMNKNGAK